MNQVVHDGYVSKSRGCNRICLVTVIGTSLDETFLLRSGEAMGGSSVAYGWLKKWLSDGGGMVAGRGMG